MTMKNFVISTTLDAFNLFLGFFAFLALGLPAQA